MQSGWDVFSQIAGFFSTATDVCPVIGAELMCRALAMADSRVSSLESGPTPAEREGSEVRGQDWSLVCVQVHDGDLLCSPLGRFMVRRTSSATSDDRRPFNLLSQNSCRQTDDRQLNIGCGLQDHLLLARVGVCCCVKMMLMPTKHFLLLLHIKSFPMERPFTVKKLQGVQLYSPTG